MGSEGNFVNVHKRRRKSISGFTIAPHPSEALHCHIHFTSAMVLNPEDPFPILPYHTHKNCIIAASSAANLSLNLQPLSCHITVHSHFVTHGAAPSSRHHHLIATSNQTCNHISSRAPPHLAMAFFVICAVKSALHHTSLIYKN